MYAVLTSVLQEEDRAEERAKTDVETHVQSMDFFAVKRLGTAMPWLKAAFETPETMLIRREPLLEQEPTWCCQRRFTRRN